MKTKAEIISTGVLCKQPGRYIGWPTIAQAANGDLLTVFSGDRDGHVCMAGKTQMVRSTDNGQTWSESVTINNTPMDDRDAGIVALPDGTLIISWFTSYHHPDNPQRSYGESWRSRIEQITDEEREQWLGGPVPGHPYEWLSGYWIRRSLDHGYSWEPPIKILTSAPHGPVALADSSLLYVGAPQHYNPNKRIVVQKSLDQGLNWKVVNDWNALVENGDYRLVEPHAVEVEPGWIIGIFRCEKMGRQVAASKRDYAVLWQAESTDGGTSWNQPRPTEIWGKPPHLTKLRDGRILLTYGHRREPFGERACISYDAGETWDYENEIILSNAVDGDLGYPASQEMTDGTIVTVYYEKDQPGEKTCLKATTWRLI